MTAHRIDGKALAAALNETISGVKAHLAVLLVGDHPASALYVRNKQRAAQTARITVTIHHLPSIAKQNDLEARIDSLNADKDVTGILLQLPLPVHLDSRPLLDQISPQKDVDGLGAANKGLCLIGNPKGLWPCTGLAADYIAQHIHGPDLQGLHAVVVGRSQLVGRPAAELLLRRNATVTLCHRHTKDLAKHTSRADILVSAVGQAGLITPAHVKHGATVIDVGIVKTPEDGKLRGDAAYKELLTIAGAITPVPGGVGPLTVAFLLQNIVKTAQMA